MSNDSTNACDELANIPCDHCQTNPLFGQRQCKAICIGNQNGRCKRVVTHYSGMCWQHRDDQMTAGGYSLSSRLDKSEIVDALLYRIREVEGGLITTVVFSHNITVSKGDFYGLGNPHEQAALLTPAFIDTVQQLVSIGKKVVIATDENVKEAFVRTVLELGFQNENITNEIQIAMLPVYRRPAIGHLRRQSRSKQFQMKLNKIVDKQNNYNRILFIDNREEFLIGMMKAKVKVIMITGSEGYGSVNPEYFFTTLLGYPDEKTRSQAVASRNELKRSLRTASEISRDESKDNMLNLQRELLEREQNSLFMATSEVTRCDHSIDVDITQINKYKNSIEILQRGKNKNASMQSKFEFDILQNELQIKNLLKLRDSVSNV